MNAKIPAIAKASRGNFAFIMLAARYPVFSYTFSNHIPSIRIRDIVALEKIKLLLAYQYDLDQGQYTYSTTFGCLRFFSKEISLIAVDGTPSSSFSSLIFLIATNSPVSRFLALYTTP